MISSSTSILSIEELRLLLNNQTVRVVTSEIEIEDTF